MFPKSGKVFPKKGKVLPAAGRAARMQVGYAAAIASALAEQFSQSHHATKTVMRWTGAGERTVKNWFAGKNGPSGEHLVALMRHSDPVFDAVLLGASRERGKTSQVVAEIREALTRTLDLVCEL